MLHVSQYLEFHNTYLSIADPLPMRVPLTIESRWGLLAAASSAPNRSVSRREERLSSEPVLYYTLVLQTMGSKKLNKLDSETDRCL